MTQSQIRNTNETQEKNTQYEIATNNKEHNETEFFFLRQFFFFKLGLLSVTFLRGRLRVNPFFFTMWAYQIRNGNSDAEKKLKTKHEARHNQTSVMFNQIPDSTFDFTKNKDSIKKF